VYFFPHIWKPVLLLGTVQLVNVKSSDVYVVVVVEELVELLSVVLELDEELLGFVNSNLFIRTSFG